MGAALLITLREGIEAALIITILLAYLRRLGRTDAQPLVWWGAGVAIAVSVIVGAVIFAAAAEFEGVGEQVFEGIVSLVAFGVLTWMIFWMRRQSASIKGELQHRVDSALLGGGYALATLAFVVVVREGIETALFVFGADKATAGGAGGTVGGIVGAVVGLLIAALLGYLLYRGSIHMNLRSFFRVTGALILIVAAGLLAFAVGEFQEAGVLPGWSAVAFDISRTLPDDSGIGSVLRALIGYNAAPTVLQLASWLAALIVSGVLFLTPPRARQPSSPTAPTSAPPDAPRESAAGAPVDPPARGTSPR
jgi:high-affinity iron transporter